MIIVFKRKLCKTKEKFTSAMTMNNAIIYATIFVNPRYS